MRASLVTFIFFFNDTATTEIYTLSLHDALPICPRKALGSIPLASSVLVLREVEVQTQRETFNPSLDRRRYNVDHDVVAQSSTAADLLAKVPSVQVDFDGSVTMRGHAT